MAHLRGARASFLCVTETESMATVCPSPHTAPQVAVTYTRPTKRCAPNTHQHVVKNVLARSVKEVSIGAGLSLGG